MATYKVIQDIEAEDKLLIWMTPRQAIYAAIVLISGFIWFLLASNGAWWLGIIFLPHMILFTVLAGPFMHDQPSEVWLLARVQFALKPRKRIWDQSGLKELVTVTVPKKIERQLTDGLSQTEVKSRLQALANTIDSRGWAVKNVNVNLYTQPSYATASLDTDRLVDTSALPQEVPTHDVSPADDILDEHSNPTAQNLDRMIHESAQTHRKQAIASMQQATEPQTTPDYWFLNATAGQRPDAPDGFATFNHNQTVIPGKPEPGALTNDGPLTADEEALLEQLHTQKKRANPGQTRLKTIKPLAEQQAEAAAAAKKRKTEEAKAPKPAINPVNKNLSQNNDFNLSTLSRQAKKELSDGDEVVIPLR